jgi:hypothetical protein
MRRTLRVVGGVVGFVVVCVAWYVVVGLIPALGPVSQPALLYSVANDVGVSGGTGSLAVCHPVGSGVRRCFVTYPGDSTSTTYRVTMRGYHCWRAVRTDRTYRTYVGSGWPLSPSGCVHIADQIRFWNRLHLG